MLARLREARLALPLLLSIPVLALLLGLGTWQWQRKAWKEALLATIAERAAAAPRDWSTLSRLDCRAPGEPDPGLSCQYVRARLDGTFDHTRERHVFVALPASAGDRGGPGYYVFTPFRPTGAAYDIVVNRGFVPEAMKSAAGRTPGQIAGPTSIEGIVRRAQSRATFDARDDAARNIYFVRDPVELGLVPAASPVATSGAPAGGPFGEAARRWFYLDLAAPTPPAGLPRPAPGPAALTNRHLEYALTWWGLAATFIAILAAFVRQRLHHAGR